MGSKLKNMIKNSEYVSKYVFQGRGITNFFRFLGEISWVQINESIILWWRFFAASDQTVDPHHMRVCVMKVWVTNNKHHTDNRWRRDIFTWELKSGKITERRRRKIHYQSSVYRNFRYVLVYLWVRIGWKAPKVSFSLEKKKVYLYWTLPPRRMRCWIDTCNCTVIMYGFVITIAIAGVMVEIECKEFRHYP